MTNGLFSGGNESGQWTHSWGKRRERSRWPVRFSCGYQGLKSGLMPLVEFNKRLTLVMGSPSLQAAVAASSDRPLSLIFAGTVRSWRKAGPAGLTASEGETAAQREEGRDQRDLILQRPSK